jgi:hypothetical protein
MVIDGQEENLILAAWPPGVWRGVMLIEFSDAGTLPASAGLGAGRLERAQEPGQASPQMGSQGGARSDETQAPGQFVDYQGKVQRPAGRHELAQEILHLARPRLTVIAAGGTGLERLGVVEPLVPQSVELGAAYLKALGGGRRIQSSPIELAENVGDVACGQTPS